MPTSAIERFAMPPVGGPAPDFRLPAAQGGEVGLGDYRERASVVLWFGFGLS